MNHFLGKSVGGLFAVLSACVLPACKTDLSDVWNSIDNIDDRLSQVEKKIEEMNTNIDALGKICDALSSNVSVSSVTPLQDALSFRTEPRPRSTTGQTRSFLVSLPGLRWVSLMFRRLPTSRLTEERPGPGFPERTESPSLKVSRLMSPPPRSHWSWLTER